ncbi:hypothetical protein G6F66_015100 [Rhizopus arrhizus]|nr:hypothetical protein G6F66_015100 [Rhizopus arrhizus]
MATRSMLVSCSHCRWEGKWVATSPAAPCSTASEAVGRLHIHPPRFTREMPVAFDEAAGGVHLVEQVLDVGLELPLLPRGLPAHIEHGVGLHRLSVEADAFSDMIHAEANR